MFDSIAWLERVRTFLRRLAQLPGNLSIHDCIEPAINDAHQRQWLDSSECSLPDEVREFLSGTSAHCSFSYSWTPPTDCVHHVPKFLAGTKSVSGGADLCNAADYSVYDHRSFFRDLRERQPPQLQTLLFRDVPEVERGDLLCLAKASKGEQLALEIGPANSVGRVVCAPISAFGPRRKVSASFTEFLAAWELICYIVPTYENLQPWIDPATGHLNPDQQRTQLLRTFFGGLFS